ncbi:MAG: hypothetical protein JWM56_954, partial [Candidatus Peribacteria bacterium]|nr:hypothetical protein [Candidatus Peribacteria bacterium]
MYKKHLLHFWLTVAALLLSAVALVAELNGVNFFTFISGFSEWHYIPFAVVTLCVAFIVLVMEWRAIAGQLRIKEVSLASIEFEHPYVPRREQIALVGLLTLVYLAFLPPISVKMYAASADILSSVTGSTDSMPSGTGSDVATVSGSTAASESSLVTGSGAATDAVTGGASADSSVSSSGSSVTDIGSVTGSTLSGNTLVSSASSGEQTSEVASESSGAADSSESSVAFSQSSSSEVPFAQGQLVLHTRDGVNAFEATAMPSFTLVNINLDSTPNILNTDGTLKTTVALQEIVKSVVTDDTIKSAVVQAAIADSQQEIAREVTTDSISVTTMRDVSGGDERHLRDDILTEKVREVVSNNAIVQDQLTDSIRSNNAVEKLLDASVTDTMKQAIVDSVVSQAMQTGDPLLTQTSSVNAAVLGAVEQNSADLLSAVAGEVVNTVSTSDSAKAIIANSVADTARKPVTGTAADATISLISVALTSGNGTVSHPKFHFAKGSVVLVLEPISRFTPGMYTLAVSITNPLTGETTTQTQNFAWGVLAMNTNQDRYRPGDIAQLNMGVLDDAGNMVCDAALALDITEPDGNVLHVSTADQSIEQHQSCSAKVAGVTEPDFSAFMTMTQSGTYVMRLTAETPNGTRTISSHVQVTPDAPFIVTRKAATRLYPVGGSPMQVTVDFLQDFHGTVTDFVPDGFNILGSNPQATVQPFTDADGNTETSVAWQGSWPAGSSVTYTYIYDAPDISPQFYLVGPLMLDGPQAGDAQYEARQWQIANDAPATDSLVGYLKFDETSAGSTTIDAGGDGNNGTLNGASGANNKPQPSSDVPTMSFTDVRSLNFDGTDDYVSAGTTGVPTGTASRTIAGWIKPNVSATVRVPFVYGNCVSAGQAFGFYLDASNIINFWGCSAADFSTGVSVTSGTWTHVAITYDGTNVKVFKNGVQAGSTTARTLATTSNFWQIGAGSLLDPSNYFFPGYVDDVRVYSRALTATELTDLAAGNHIQAQWVGGTSANFELAANWSINSVPDPYSRLKIVGAINNPVMTRAESGAGLIITATGSLDFAGQKFTMNDAGTVSNAGTIRILGSETLTGFTNDSANGTVLVYGTGSTYTGLPTGSNYNNLTLDTGLVGYWKMDEGVGTVAKDSSRNGNNGVLINGPAWSGSSLPTTRFYNNKSLKFDGLDDYVEVPASSRLTGFSAFTVSMWVKWRTFGGSFPILIAKGDDTNREYLLYAWQSTNRLSFEVYNPSSQILNVDNVVSTGSWLHIAATFKGGTTQELYVNGVRVGSRTPSSGNVRDLSKKLAIGREGESSLYYTNGNIDDVRVYSRALSALEISTLAAGNPASGSGKVILSSNLLVNGNLSLYNSALDVSASNYSVTVKGNIQNTGNFVKQSGLVVLGGTGNQTISGSTIFNNFTATGSSARKLFLDYTSRQSASGALTLRGLTANLLSIRSTRFGSGARVLLDGDSGTQTIDYLDVKDSIATGGAALVCYTNSEGCVDSGNNFNWNIAAQTSSISGRLYGNTGATLGLASKTVAVSLNGQTAVGTTTTDANGNFTITGITQTTLTGGTVVALYVDNNTEKAVTVSHGSGGSMTGMTLIRDTLVIQSGTGGTALGRPVTSNELAFANNVDTDITSVYTDSSTNITVVTGKRMEVRQGGVASLGGTLTTSFLHMNTLSGSLIQGSNSITVNTALTQSGGTFVGGSQTINMVGNFTLGGGRFISTSSGMIVSGDFIHPTAGIFSHNSGTMIFAGGLSATMDVAGTEIFNNFTANKSNLLTIASGDTAQVNGLFSWLTNRILLGTINAKGDVSITGASHGSNGSPSTVQLSGSSTQTCTISAGAGITGLTISNPLATCTLIGAGTVSIFSALTVAGGTFNAGSTNLLVGTMTISSGTFNAPSSTLSISFGWTHTAGTFNHNNGTVSLVTSGTRTFSVPGNEIFYNLTMAGASDASTANMTAGNTFTVLNTFAHTNGILNTGQLRLKGNTVIQSGSDGGSALLQFTGTGTQLLTNIGGIVTTGNWTVAKPSGVLTLSGGALSLNTSGQDLIMTGGTLNLNGNNLTVNRTFTVGTGTTLKLKGTETITGGPDFIHKGAIIYYTEPSQTLRLKNFTPNYQNLVLGSTGSAIFRPFQNMSLSGSLTISGGTLQFDGGQSLTISGSYLRTGGAFTSGTGTMILLTNGQAKTLNETSAFNNLAIDDGLVGYWKMDEGVGTVAKDLSRNGSNGVLTNGPAWSGSSLPTTRFFNSKTLNFDGVDDMVNISDTSSVFGGMKAVTISAWIYPRTTGGSSFGRVITKNDVSQFGIVYNPNSAGNVAGLYVGAVSPQITASAPLNTWTHVAFTWNGSTITSYSNGVSAGSFANTTVLAADTNPLVIGNRSAGARTWNGFIDDVRIYNRALNASEINALSTGNPATGSGKLTLGSTLTLNGNLGLYGSTLDVSSSNYNISLKGNLQNSGDFIRRSGTVNLTGTTAQTISGSTIWNNLAKTVSTAQNLFLDYTSRQSASGSLTLRGLTANLLSLRSTRSGSGAGILLDGDSGTQTIDYLDVKDSIATGGATLVCYINTEGCVDSGNNFNWTLAAQTKSISGKAYSNTGATTPLAGRTIAVSLNGQAAAGTAATDAGGQFAITGISQTALTGGTIVSLYIDGATEKAVTVSHGSGGSMTGMTLIKDTLVIQSGTGGTRLGNPV